MKFCVAENKIYRHRKPTSLHMAYSFLWKWCNCPHILNSAFALCWCMQLSSTEATTDATTRAAAHIYSSFDFICQKYNDKFTMTVWQYKSRPVD